MLPSKVMFSGSCRCAMSNWITSPNTSSTYLYLSSNLSDFFNQASVYLLFTYSNHLKIACLILSTTEVTPIFSRISLFLILSLSVCLYIHLNILIFITSIFWTCDSWFTNTPPHTNQFIKLTTWWHTLITQDTTFKPLFHPPHSSMMCSIIISLPISLDYRLKILETSSFGDDLYIIPHFHICLMDYLIELAPSTMFLVLLNLNSLDSRVCLWISSLSLTPPQIWSINTMPTTNNIHHGI